MVFFLFVSACLSFSRYCIGWFRCRIDLFIWLFTKIVFNQCTIGTSELQFAIKLQRYWLRTQSKISDSSQQRPIKSMWIIINRIWSWWNRTFNFRSSHWIQSRRAQSTTVKEMWTNRCISIWWNLFSKVRIHYKMNIFFHLMLKNIFYLILIFCPLFRSIWNYVVFCAIAKKLVKACLVKFSWMIHMFWK